MLGRKSAFLASIVLFASSSWLCGAQLSPEEWGAPAVTVSHSAGKWTLSGKKNKVVLDELDLSTTLQAGGAIWKMVSSSAKDILVRASDDEFNLRLADAGEITITPYQTVFKTGVKITLGEFRNSGQHSPGSPLDLRLFLTMCLEGGDEDLIFEAAAVERDTVIRELNWPTAIDGRDVDYTVLSNDDGMLLPRDWPKPFHPIHRAQNDTSIIQSNLIESWSMSWWGFQRGNAI